MAVLTEGRGTCSTKHALQRSLQPNSTYRSLSCLGIYLMSEPNTPGVGSVITRHGLAEIPEAHCYLMHDGVRIDVTRETTAPSEPIATVRSL